MKITATIITLNEERTIVRAIESLRCCDEILILDSGSTDRTVELATILGARVLEPEWRGYAGQRNWAAEQATHDWILSIDSDEVLSPALIEELGNLELDSSVVYAMPFRNHFNGRHITTCGWSPDFHERLFDRRVTGFGSSESHERGITRIFTN